MGKVRGRSPNLEKEVNELRKENGRLKKALRKLNGTIENFVIKEDESNTFIAIEKKKESCPECVKGELHPVSLGIFNYHFCSMCKYRKKV